jgi:hypothetical protein
LLLQGDSEQSPDFSNPQPGLRDKMLAGARPPLRDRQQLPIPTDS